jgi:hypothetical protein
LLRHCATFRKVPGSVLGGVTGDFYSVTSYISMCLGSTQTLKMSTRILLGVKTAGAKADNRPPSSADVTESGSLKLPESSGLHSPVMGILYV